MATTSLWAVRGTIRDVVAYVKDPNKTANPDYDLKNVLTYGNALMCFLRDWINALFAEKYQLINLCNKILASDRVNSCRRLFSFLAIKIGILK